MNEAIERLFTAATKRLADVPENKHADALVEVDPGDVVVGLASPVGDAAIEALRVALVEGARASNGRPVAVRPDHLLRVLGS